MSEPRKFYRSQDNKIIAGVCGGLAEYYQIDSTLVRATVAALILAGIGLVFYIALWIFVPFAPAAGSEH
jgi:phage shock protein PspC (stress-responsive transcriptional regulator)